MNEKKIKVVMGINDFLVGGAQKLIVDQLVAFDRNAFDITLITLFEFPKRKNFYNEIPSDVNLIGLRFKGFFDVLSWVRLIKILGVIKPDVVCSHLFFSNAVFRLLKPFLGYKVIAVEHNTYIDKKKKHIFVDWILSHLTFKIVAVSRSVRDFASKQAGIPKNKFEVINNGIDLGPIKELKRLMSKEDIRTKLGFEKHDLILVNNGRLVNQKNHLLLIEAFEKFYKSHNEAKLIILGEGELLADLKSRVEGTSIHNSIYFLGVVSHDSVLQYFRAGDFLVSTSFIEGLSIAYLEALASGLPIIATKTAGTDDLIEEGTNGFFIESLDKETTVLAFEKALASDYDKLSQSAIETSVRYNIYGCVSRYADLFRKAVK